MWLGANVPQRIDRLVLCNTSPKIYSPEVWNTRIDTVRKSGVAVIADAVLKGWFTTPFRERAPQAVARMRGMLATTPTEGYVACCAALRDMDQWKALATIKLPTLVIAGTYFERRSGGRLHQGSYGFPERLRRRQWTNASATKTG